MTRYDMDGNRIKDSEIISDRTFYGVPVVITSTIWESGVQIFESDSPEEAMKMYEAGETPLDTDYTGWQDQEYRSDEFDDTVDGIELIPNTRADVQWILKRDEEKKNDI